MAGKREENPAGSSNNLRGDVLRVLGVGVHLNVPTRVRMNAAGS
ncbi:hypothetical protein [Streptomyces alanosinicus]|nr:hypothetical protein [Streptomyces alanosinicus]